MNDTQTLPTQPPPPANPYGQPYGAPSARPGSPGSAGPQQRRGRFAAGVLAAALVVGGGAGLGGAAAYDALNGDEPSAAPGPGTRRSRRRAPPTLLRRDDDGSVEAVADKVLPSVVQINVSGAQGSGSGSGIILTEDGQILTNNHVVEVAPTAVRSASRSTTAPGARPTVLGTDVLTDTAVIQAEGVSGLTPATIGSSDELEIGQAVVAIGSPFGLESTVTSGIVSALNRPVNVGDDGQGNTTTYPAIQTDAAINPGNSGGAARRPRRQRRRHQLLDPHRLRRAATARSGSGSRSRSTGCCRSSSRWPTARSRPTPASASGQRGRARVRRPPPGP